MLPDEITGTLNTSLKHLISEHGHFIMIMLFWDFGPKIMVQDHMLYYNMPLDHIQSRRVFKCCEVLHINMLLELMVLERVLLDHYLQPKSQEGIGYQPWHWCTFHRWIVKETVPCQVDKLEMKGDQGSLDWCVTNILSIVLETSLVKIRSYFTVMQLCCWLCQ